MGTSSPPPSPLDRLSVVLVQPRTAGNIGSVCRACKTMGVSQITIVDPPELDHPDISKFGWNSEDVIHNIRTTSTLEEALSDAHITIATTQRHRAKGFPVLPARELVQSISPHLASHNVALVFGRENNGLSNDELSLCQWISSIPSHTSRPALNLAQAVMVYVYEFFAGMGGKPQLHPPLSLSSHRDQSQLYSKLEDAIDTLPITTRHGPHAFATLFKRVLGRTFLETRDVALFLKLFDAIIKK